MIKIHGTRQRGGEFFKDCPPLRESTLEKALECLVGAELKYGGHITKLTPTEVVVETRVMACLDTTYFEGSEEEMAPLVALAYYYSKARSEQNGEIVEDCVSQLEKLPEQIRGNAFFVVNLSPQILGSSTLKRALQLMQEAQE